MLRLFRTVTEAEQRYHEWKPRAEQLSGRRRDLDRSAVGGVRKRQNNAQQQQLAICK